MTNQNFIDFPKLAVSFLTDYLPLQRGFSSNTVLSYRDTFKLFLKFLVHEKSVDLKDFHLKDFNRELVIDFLSDYRNGGASPRTANQRLAALKSFCCYASVENPECMDNLLGIRAIKFKRSPGREISFLTPEQTKALVNAPDTRTRTGLRHKAILTVLYDSACRVQELCDIDVGDVFLCEGTSTVRLHGKGNKPRTVFLSKSAAKVLELYKERFHRNALATEPFIHGRYGGRIQRSGVAYVVAKYASRLALDDPAFPDHVHCHMLRHSKAMHMLQSGVALPIIRDFLGHEDISTTMNDLCPRRQ